MFEQRLTWFWISLTAIAVVIIGRLAQIQIVDAANYQALAERILTRPPQYLIPPRGSVFDRTGLPLLRDDPTSDICIHYGALVRRPDYLLYTAARELRSRGEYPPDTKLRTIADDLPEELDAMWVRLAALTGLPTDEIDERVERICSRVERWRRASGQEKIQEENQFLPVIENVDADMAVAVRLELEHYPWLQVQPGSRRVAHNADPVAHLLGRMGEASAARIAGDPLHGIELRELRRRDRCGTSGVEYMAETALRGQRGRILAGYDRRVLERIDPLPGHDVYLTIDLELQRTVLDLLTKAVEGDPETEPPGGLPENHRAGAAAVVIDVATRDIRALVSYPTFSYNNFSEDYAQLRQDTRREPLLFRAVSGLYPPGSTCKAISLIAGLGEGVVTPDTRFHCTGHLLPDNPSRFRCWVYNQNPGWTHDMIDDPAGQNGESAVRNSCNIYFYKVGGLLGPERLCKWFGRFGLGRVQGTGLIEESPGIVPTEAWLSDPARGDPRGYRTSDAWNFAIGQGEVTATPLQVANVAATVAAGFWAPVHLAYDDSGQVLGSEPAPVQPFAEDHLRVLRRGMWRVVNERGGTAPRARIDHPRYELCGKTGSAQTGQRILNRRYTFEWPDGHREERIAVSLEEALETFGDEKPECVGYRAHERYPYLEEGEKVPAHAWFMGYTQPVSTPRGHLPSGRVYAISVIVEFGDSGGRVAGPVARQIAEYLLKDE